MLLFSGCDKEEQIPSYIYISEFVLDTKNTNFGSNSHDFVDAWVYANNKLIVSKLKSPITAILLFEKSCRIFS